MNSGKAETRMTRSGPPSHTHTPPGSSGVDEGHHDVAGALGGGQALVVVGEAAGMHEGPALPGRLHLTVVAQEPAASTLENTGR